MAFFLCAVIGCASNDSNSLNKEPNESWEITYFALGDGYQAVQTETTHAKSVIVGRVDTSEILVRTMSDNGLPLPCITERKGQIVEKSGRSFLVSVDSDAGLFSVPETANGHTVRLHVTESDLDEQFQISKYNVTAIEYKR